MTNFFPKKVCSLIYFQGKNSKKLLSLLFPKDKKKYSNWLGQVRLGYRNKTYIKMCIYFQIKILQYSYTSSGQMLQLLSYTRCSKVLNGTLLSHVKKLVFILWDFTWKFQRCAFPHEVGVSFRIPVVYPLETSCAKFEFIEMYFGTLFGPLQIPMY